MLFVLFRLGGNRYALNVSDVREVLPLVSIRQMPQAPAAVAGIFNYRGAPVPVIDLSQLTLGRPAQIRVSTRIVLVDYPDAGGTFRLLGLLAERATETLRLEPADFTTAGITNATGACLGPVNIDADGIVQWIDVRQLLSAALRDLLFEQPVPCPVEA